MLVLVAVITAGSASPAAAAPGGNWRQDQKSARRNATNNAGVVISSNNVRRLRPAWTSTCATGAAVVYGDVFCGDAMDDGSDMVVRRRVDGAEVWRFRGALGGVSATPAVVNGRVFFSTWSPTGTVYAFQVNPKRFLWSRKLGDAVTAVAEAGGVLYAGSESNANATVWALAADTGTPLWSTRAAPGAAGAEVGPPTVARGEVFVAGGISNSDVRIYALDALTGTKRWEFPLGRAFTAGETVADGTVFFRTIGSSTPTLDAVDATTGRLEWSQPVGGYGAPVAIGGDLLFTCNPAPAAFSRLTGRLVWQGSYGCSDVSFANGLLFVDWTGVGLGASLRVLDAATGRPLVRLNTGRSEAAPSVTGDMVFAGATAFALPRRP